MAHLLYRSIFITCLLLAASCLSSHAQRTLGVKWNIPEDQDKAAEQLEQFNEMGVSILEVTPPVNSRIWNKIDELGFTVFGDIGIQYPTSSTFSRPDSSLIEHVQNQSISLLSQSSVEAIGLFNHGAIYDQEFQKAVNPFIFELQKAGESQVYYVTRCDQLSFKNSLAADFEICDVSVTTQNWNTLSITTNNTIGGYRYVPAENLSNFLSPFKHFLETTQTVNKPIFVEGTWLLSMIESHPQFKKTVQSISSNPKTIFPVPDESIPRPQQSSFPVLLLIITWASVAIHYNGSPLYRKSLFRYFVAHKFFIEDIFHRHIRSASPAIILLLQNAALIAAGVYALVTTSFTKLGLEALFSHIPSAALFGANALGLAIWASAISLALSFISILWLYISHKEINSLTQIATIYAWPLHINLIICTIGLAFFASSENPFLISFLTVLIIPVQLCSFVISSFDAAKFIKSRSLLYISATSILYLGILCALLIWGVSYKSWWEAIHLALNL